MYLAMYAHICMYSWHSQYVCDASISASVEREVLIDMLHIGQFCIGLPRALCVMRKNTFSCKTLNVIELVSLLYIIPDELMIVLCG